MATATAATGLDATVEAVEAYACTIPTDAPESDGTLEWDSTTIVVVEVRAGGETGLGYTYADASAAHFVRTNFTDLLRSLAVSQVRKGWVRMGQAIRNAGARASASAPSRPSMSLSGT